ncbi:MAG: M15 family metallopeptidase, partial [Eubacteriales bacterium]
MISKNAAGFVLLSDVVPHIVQEIRYFSTYNFVGERVDGYEEPVALLTREAARALKAVSNEMMVKGYRLKVFDAYRPVTAVKHFLLWAIEDEDVRMKPYFYPDIDKQDAFERGYIAKQS